MEHYKIEYDGSIYLDDTNTSSLGFHWAAFVKSEGQVNLDIMPWQKTKDPCHVPNPLEIKIKSMEKWNYWNAINGEESTPSDSTGFYRLIFSEKRGEYHGVPVMTDGEVLLRSEKPIFLNKAQSEDPKCKIRLEVLTEEAYKQKIENLDTVKK